MASRDVRTIVAASIAGVAALTAVLVVLETHDPRLDGSLAWLAATSYGAAIGIAAALVSVIAGGEIVRNAVTATLFAVGFAATVLLGVLAVEAHWVLPVLALPLVVLVLAPWVAAAVGIMLGVPALTCSVAVAGICAYLRDGHNTQDA